MRKYILVVLILFGVLLAACKSKTMPDVVKSPTAQQRSDVTYQSKALKRRVAIVKIHANRLSSRLLEVKALIRNTTSKDLWVDVQVIFKDESGFEVEKTNWQPLFLPKKQDTTYTQTSLNNNSYGFNLLIRNPAESKAK